jgi:hypothetical protein
MSKLHYYLGLSGSVAPLLRNRLIPNQSFYHEIGNYLLQLTYTWHSFSILTEKSSMNNFWRSIIAGYAGWKWGGGCLGFIVVFFIVFWLLGYVNC